MRRLLSILLLALLGLPFAAPLFAATGPGSETLPACCRRDGKHHCLLSMEERGRLAARDPQMRAPSERCPYLPDLLTVAHSNLIAAPAAQAIFAGLTSHPAVFAQMESRWRIARDRSRQKRGPPSEILS